VTFFRNYVLNLTGALIVITQIFSSKKTKLLKQLTIIGGEHSEHLLPLVFGFADTYLKKISLKLLRFWTDV